ncbi:MAG: divalent-cation tolerance protein CutA [Candidatus Bathyarchaeota archaeon]|nr:MAG: divalent-cation tolerance protein CutA [Candidatus Bathyarchaeota archaeon]
MSSKKYIQIVTTVDTEEKAEKIAHTLVRDHLAACSQVIGPISSIYWWKKRIEKQSEWLCIIKTRRDLYKAVESSILRHHTYEIPEILAIPISEGQENYLRWMGQELSSKLDAETEQLNEDEK